MKHFLFPLNSEALQASQDHSKSSEAVIRSLYEITTATHLSLEERFQSLLMLGCRHFELDHGFLAAIEDNCYTVISAQTPNHSASVGDRFDARQTYCIETLQMAEPLSICHISQSEWCHHPCRTLFSNESYIGMRVLVTGQPYGALCFYSQVPRSNPFKAVDRELLKLMAQWCGGELERQQVASALQQQLERAALLKRITERIRENLDAKQIFQTTAAQIGEALQVNRCTIHTYLSEPTPYAPLMAEYREPEYESLTELPTPTEDASYLKQVLAVDQAVALPQLAPSALLQPVSTQPLSLKPDSKRTLKSLLSVRTSYQGKPNGVISIHHYSTPRDWTIEEIELLGAIADQVGIALEQARLLQQEIQQRKTLTQQNLALEEAKHAADSANRAKGDFLAMMSHEIRTPMNAVIGMTELLLESTLTPQQHDLVQTIRNSGDALLAIINGILDFSKIESGKLDLEHYQFNLRTCLEESLQLLTSKASEKELDLVYKIDPQTPELIFSDSNRLRQILVNLISNAVKFTQVGEVTVSVTAHPLKRQVNSDDDLLTYSILFSVKDTGMGIPSDRLDRLFQPFTQVDSSISRTYGGTGLGLVICQRLCELMGGRIWVDSEMGQGTTFHFCIVAEALREATIAPLPGAPLMGKRLLLLDRNQTRQANLRSQALGWGMAVQTAQSEAEMLNDLQSPQLFDVIVLDQRLSGSLATILHQHPQTSTVPLVLLTSHELFRGEQVKSMGAKLEPSLPPVVSYLHQPVKQSEFYNVLLNLFEKQTPLLASPISHKLEVCPIERPPLRILLAEDNAVNQKIALLLLEHIGYRADVVNNGLEAIEALQQQQYDVVFMDVQMPEIDGLRTTRLIHQMWQPTLRPYIIAMTANAMQGDREQCLQAGMDDYISKPIRLETLIAALDQHRSSHRDTMAPRSFENLDQGDDPPAQSNHTTSPNPQAKDWVDDTQLESIHTLVTFDRTILEYTAYQIVGEDTSAFMVEMIECYLDDAPKLVQSLKTSFTERNALMLKQAAHTLKSSSATLGALQLAALCKTLEQSLQSWAFAAESYVMQIEKEYNQVQVALRLETIKLKQGV